VASPGHPPLPNERHAIACPTSSGWNPYLDLLYGALEREGVPFEPNARLTAGWLFEPGDRQSLASALDAAFSASDEELKRRGDLAAAQAAGLRWEEPVRRFAALLRGRYT
jgi:hypothetical protein